MSCFVTLGLLCKFSHHPNLVPIGSKFFAGKCADAKKLLSTLVDVAAIDPHVPPALNCVAASADWSTLQWPRATHQVWQVL